MRSTPPTSAQRLRKNSAVGPRPATPERLEVVLAPKFTRQAIALQVGEERVRHLEPPVAPHELPAARDGQLIRPPENW
jgi:hypothetical protein